MRHPQYSGLLLIVVGFLFQWPTMITIVLFPVLVVAYRRLAISEDQDMVKRFGTTWEVYASVTPRFVPRRGTARRPAAARHPGQVRQTRPDAGLCSRGSVPSGRRG